MFTLGISITFMALTAWFFSLNMGIAEIEVPLIGQITAWRAAIWLLFFFSGFFMCCIALGRDYLRKHIEWTKSKKHISHLEQKLAEQQIIR
tara:strand:- start:311 stop:583 length:273 start_codon:yes stop_codon:yes gene_type:complete